MSITLPDCLDPWRTVQARRVFEGTLPLAQMRRLSELLAGPKGEIAYQVEFGRDEFDIDYLDIRVDGQVPMICQRRLVEFMQPVLINQRLGLLRDESEEARLPEG